MPAPNERAGNRPWRLPARRQPVSAWAAVFLVTLVLAACSAATPPAASGTATGSARAAPTEPRGGADDELARDCGTDVDALDDVITAQLAAFAADDWDRGLALTSRQFRSTGIDADGLRRIVTSGYAQAADAAGHEVLGCVRSGDDAQVLTEITATDGSMLELVYLMTREDGRWRISGAVEHDTRTTAPPTVSA